MIKENFIKLYENSFRENWDLPCYTDYGESVHYTYGQVCLLYTSDAADEL